LAWAEKSLKQRVTGVQETADNMTMDQKIMPSIPMLELYAREFGLDGPDIPTGRKGRIFTRVCLSDQPTRKKLASDMGIRPATVSEIALELINDGLVLEARPDRSLQKGRPEIILSPNPDRLVAIVCYLVSHSIHCALVNLGGDTLYEAHFDAEAGRTDKPAFVKIISELFADCLGHVPQASELAGVAFSLPGIVDETNGIWCYSSHWPKLRNFDLSGLAEHFECNVTLSKNLNCELRARISRRSDQATESLLLLHWGFGVGAAFANGGDISISERKGFGEVGHSCVDPASQAICRCGMTGCIEAEAGIWALSESLEDRSFPREEWKFEQYLRDNPDLEAWDRPINLMALMLRNLSLTLSPDQCVITGPFSQNSRVFSRLVARFEELLPKKSLVVGEPRITLRSGRRGTQDEIIGAASTVFSSALMHLFRD